MSSLIYYYPLSSGAPSEVSRSIFSELANKNLHFKIAVFPQYRKGKTAIKEKYNNIDIATFKDIFKLSTESVIHFTMSPLIFPNRKFLLYLFSLLSRKKFIINYHGDPRTEFKIKLSNRDLSCLFQFPHYMLSPLILESADIIIVNSVFMKNLFQSQYNIKNLVVIPNGIDPSWLSDTNINKDIKNKNQETLSLFYHGRLAPEKGVDILIKSVYRLIREYDKNIILYIAGQGPLSKYLKKLCVELGIEKNVIFLGQLPPRILKSYLCSVDAAVYPSMHEAFSLAVLEAFCTVKGPVIYSNNTGINDFVLKEGFNFYTFEPSIEGVSNSIKMIIDKRYDEKIFCKQKEFACKYTWDNIVNEYVKIYEKYL